MSYKSFNPSAGHARVPGTLRQAQAVMFKMLVAVKSLCQANQIQFWLDGGTLLGAARHRGFIPWDDDIDIVMPRPDYERFIQIAKKSLPEEMSIQTIELDDGYRRYATPCKIRDRHSRIREAHTNIESCLFIDIIPLDRFHASGLRRYIDYRLKWLYSRLCALQHATIRQPTSSTRDRLGNLAVRGRRWLGVESTLRLYRKFLIHWVARKNQSLDDDYLIGYGFDSYWIRLFEPKDVFPLTTVEFEGVSFPAPANVDAVLRIFYGDWMTIPSQDDRPPAHFEILEIDTRCPDRSKELD